MSERFVRARHTAGLRFELVTGTGHALVIDDGTGNSGQRPTEALLGSLAACTGMDVVSILRKKRQAFTAYTVDVRGTQREEHPQVFSRIDLVHVVEGPALDEAAVSRSIELSASRYCPINAMVSAGPTEVHHRYRVLDTAREPAAIREGEVMVTGPYARVEAITR